MTTHRGPVFSATDRAKLVRAGKGARALGIITFFKAAGNLFIGRFLASVMFVLVGVFSMGGGRQLAEMDLDRSSDIKRIMLAYQSFSTVFLLRVGWVAYWTVLILIGAILTLVEASNVGFDGVAHELEDFVDDFE